MEAPMPVNMAGQRPFDKVRWMISIPTGPMGADIKAPMARPLGNMYSSCSILKSKDNKIPKNGQIDCPIFRNFSLKKVYLKNFFINACYVL